jgi:DNA polymerase-3 subunit epsilon
MRALIFDTETTDKWDFKASPDAAHQPYIVQLAAVLEDFEAQRNMCHVNVLIATEGWMIQPGAARVHGISEEIANKFGVMHANACHLFRDLVASADVVVAHNIQFDRDVMTRALSIAQVDPIPWSRVNQRCTMRTATAICKVPAVGRGGFKWPTLEEALRILCDEKIENAHDAMADVYSCQKVHRALVERGAFTS